MAQGRTGRAGARAGRGIGARHGVGVRHGIGARPGIGIRHGIGGARRGTAFGFGTNTSSNSPAGPTPRVGYPVNTANIHPRVCYYTVGVLVGMGMCFIGFVLAAIFSFAQDPAGIAGIVVAVLGAVLVLVFLCLCMVTHHNTIPEQPAATDRIGMTEMESSGIEEERINPLGQGTSNAAGEQSPTMVNHVYTVHGQATSMGEGGISATYVISADVAAYHNDIARHMGLGPMQVTYGIQPGQGPYGPPYLAGSSTAPPYTISGPSTMPTSLSDVRSTIELPPISALNVINPDDEEMKPLPPSYDDVISGKDK